MFNVSFQGIKENIAYGNQALDSLKREYPRGLKSSTHYETFVDSNDRVTISNYEKLIKETRDITSFNLRRGKTKKEATIMAVSQTGAGNCGEQAMLVSKKLDDLGIANKIISMNICPNKPPFNSRDGHNFCVIDTSADMKTQDPSTWGNDAVVVDLWSDTVAKAKDALAYFSTFLVPNKGESIHFIEVDKL